MKLLSAPTRELNQTSPKQFQVRGALWPMQSTYLLPTPPTVAAGAANAGSVIASSVRHSCFDLGKFQYLGGPASRTVNYPDRLGMVLGKYPQITSRAPAAIEFLIETVDTAGRFELETKGWGAGYRVLVMQSDGQWGRTNNGIVVHPSDGAFYKDLVTLGAPGTYEIRIECDPPCIFYGVYTEPTAKVSAQQPKPKRYIVAGDSFSEPTISDTGASKFDGWVQQLALLTGYDIWSAGSGGTGYCNPGSGRVKLSDRLDNDILSYPMDGLIIACGYNDLAYPIGSFTSEVRACFDKIRGANLDEVYVLPSFHPKGIEGWEAGFLQFNDVIKAEALLRGFVFIDILQPGGVNHHFLDPDFSTVLSTAYTSGVNCQVTDVPSYFKLSGSDKSGWWVKIGAGPNQSIREVTGITGIGPYTLTLGLALPSTVGVGAPVSLAVPSYQSGTGRMGATTGSGTSDRYTGTDGTHPSVAGHSNLARIVAAEWARSIIGQ